MLESSWWSYQRGYGKCGELGMRGKAKLETAELKLSPSSYQQQTVLTFIIDVVSGMGQDLEGAHEVHGVHASMQCE